MLKIAVVGVVNNNESILVGKKRNYKENDALGGKWHIPGGKVEENEKPESAVERELLEETGIKVKASKILDIRIAKQQDTFTVIIWYECLPLETNATSSQELSSVKWVPRSQVLSTVDKEAIEMFPSLILEYFKG